MVRPMRKLEINSIILIIGNLVSKILFLLFLYYLALDTVNIGLKYYTLAYIPFSIFLDLSSFGIIPGISKLTASLDDNRRYHLLRVGTIYSLMIGFIFVALLNLLKDIILNYSLSDTLSREEVLAINENLVIASISIFIYPIIGFYKGYLQGKGKTLPTSLSLVLEGGTRLILYFIIRKYIVSYSDLKLVYIINLSAYMMALIPLLIFVIKDYFKEYKVSSSIRYIIKNTFPFGVVTLFFTFYQLIDSLSLESLGVNSEIYTAYMFEAIRLIFIPISVSQAIGAALNPKITSLRKKNKYEEAKNIAIKSSMITIKYIIPVILVYIFYSTTLYSFFYHKTITENVLAKASILIFFIGFYKVLIGLCSSLNKFNYIIITTFISIISKIILNYILVPHFGYIGSIISTIIAISICIIVAYYILNKNKIKLFIPNIIMIIKSTIIGFISIFLTIIFRVIFPINRYPLLIELILFSIVLFSLYILIFAFFNLLTKNSKKHIIN